MPNMYQGYCYPTLNDVAQALLSENTISAASGMLSANVAVTTATPNQLLITYAYKAYSTAAQTSYQLTRLFPTCTNIGYQHNQTGIDLVDATATSWAVVGVLVAAWAITVMRKTL